MITEELNEETRRAFVAYEKAFIDRVVKRTGWRLAGEHIETVLATGDEARVRAYMEDLNFARHDLESALIV